MLLEITAFLGEQLISNVGGNWCVGIYPRIVNLIDMNTVDSSCMLFDNVIGSWRIKGITYLRENYFIVCKPGLKPSPSGEAFRSTSWV